jgi:hypothetical protein
MVDIPLGRRLMERGEQEIVDRGHGREAPRIQEPALFGR